MLVRSRGCERRASYNPTYYCSCDFNRVGQADHAADTPIGSKRLPCERQGPEQAYELAKLLCRLTLPSDAPPPLSPSPMRPSAGCQLLDRLVDQMP